MIEKLLPPYFKIIALSIGALALVGLISKVGLAAFTGLDPSRLEWILKDIILIALLFLTFAREKKETSITSKLRNQVLRNSLLFGVILIIWQSLQEIIFWDGNYEIDNAFNIMLAILIYNQVFFIYAKYKSKRKNYV